MRLRMSRTARLFVIAFVELWNFLIQRQHWMGKQLMRLRKARLFAIAFVELADQSRQIGDFLY